MPPSRCRPFEARLGGQINGAFDELGNNRIYGYAPDGQLVLIEDEFGHDTTWKLDDRALPVTKIDTASKVTSYTYDADRRMTSTTDPNALTTSYT